MLQQVALLLLVALALTCVSCIFLYTFRDKAYLDMLCAGRASLRINILLCLPVLCWNAAAIYLVPCCRAYGAWLIDGVLCAPLRVILCLCCCRHIDRSFPPKPSSIGSWEGKSIEDGNVEWVRGRELVLSGAGDGRPRAKLFEDNVRPSDVGQGAVGNCWLIAALAAAAEHPGLVQSLFLTKRASLRGKYAVRLFDWQLRRWVRMTVDEYLPATRAVPSASAEERHDGKVPTGEKAAKSLFAQPVGRELWVCIIEKAFAKFCGSYGSLDGGSTAWAFNALTGDPVFVLRKGPEEAVRERRRSAKEGTRPDKGQSADQTDTEASSSEKSTPRQSTPSEAGQASPVATAGEGESKGEGEGKGGHVRASSWERIDMRPKLRAGSQGAECSKRAVEFVGRQPAEAYDGDQTFMIVRRYVRHKSLMSASFGSYGGEGGGEGLNGEGMGLQGLVSGHAYTILDAKRFGGTKDTSSGRPLMLVQLRNPWGRGEWEGAWSDKSDEWRRHKSVKKLLRPTAVDDGAFWMSWDDFSRIFQQIDVCARRSGIADLHIDLNESDECMSNCVGPLKGCAAGCVAFWCCCQGCSALYGNNSGGEEATIGIDDPVRRGRALAADSRNAFDDKVLTRLGAALEEGAKTVQQL